MIKIIMWYYEEDYNSYFDHIKRHPKKKNIRVFQLELYNLPLIDKIINQYLWSISISKITYKIRRNEIIANMTVSEVPKITHIDIIFRETYDIFDLKDTIKFFSEMRIKNGEITNIKYLLYSGKLEFKENRDFIIAIMHSLQYDCPYHDGIIRPSCKERSAKELMNDVMRDEGFDFDLF